MRDAAPIIERLENLIGVEHGLDEVNYALKFAARQAGAPVVGAHHVTCSDESERECIESFQRCFVQDMLPRIKFSSRAPFRTSNLGARYEWHSLPIAEHHFATPESHDAFKLMVVKINAHVSVRSEHTVRHFGRFQRYETESTACGALHMLLDGSHQPFADALREQFTSEGIDRVSLLADETPEEVRSLAAALVSARMQARSAAVEAQDHKPASPTVYLIAPSVTFNQPDRDSELLVGVYLIDRRSGRGRDVYRGLSDHPSHYRIEMQHQRVHVHDEQARDVREARDHRQLVAEATRRKGALKLASDERVDRLIEQARQGRTGGAHVSRQVAKGLLTLLAELTPVSAALMLFTQGATGIYQVYRAHRLVQDVENTVEARKMLADLHDRVDHLPPDQARQVLEILLAAYNRK